MINFGTQQLEDWMNQMQGDSMKSFNRFKRLTEGITREPEPQVGQTPKEVIWTKNKTKLYRYQPAIKKTKLKLRGEY